MYFKTKITSTSKISPEANLSLLQLPLAKLGAEVILGKPITPEQLAVPLAPSAIEMFAPRGACLVSEKGSLWVSDTGHHRLLGWKNLPTQNSQPADWVIGQPDFFHEGQNAKTLPGRTTFNVPTGICACGEGLAVADAWNHRVLIWKKVPQDSHVPADLVLGQVDFTENKPNRGKYIAAANTLNWCYGVFYHQGKLFVADTGNRRVLIWHQLPTENGQPADLVLGQPDMLSRNENGGATASASSMRWCHDITVWGKNLVVTDAGNNRVMIWDGIPSENNIPCAVVVGQKSFDCVELNQGVYFPNPSSLSMPYGVDAVDDWLIVADTANSRLLGWKKVDDIRSLMGKDADGLLGQNGFHSKSENSNFGLPKRNTVNWSYGMQICGDIAVIADSGNNRILLWKMTAIS
ncbi:NHL repeat-containing protein [Calothrix sp. NIES-4101]|nr:NHL repeat-containing protein [Calothrix sp. NIES-4101]